MSIRIEVGPEPLPQVLLTVPPSSISASQSALDGEVAFGGFWQDDPLGLLATKGHQFVTIEESACAQPRLFTGYLTERDIARSLARGMIAGDDARAHQVTTVDLNAVFNFRPINGAGAKRPEETMDDRLTWLLGHESLSPFIANTGYAAGYSLDMDAADYTGAFPSAVLSDLVDRKSDTTLTYFAFWDETASAVGLYFGLEADGIGESTLSISNDLADIDNTTVFAPDAEAKLARTPEEVYSEVVVEYAGGTKRILRRRQSTADAYIPRGATIQRPYTGRATTAQAQADAWLTKHAIEQDTITVSILVPPESAGLARAGERITVRFTHLPGYESWTSMRIITSTVSPVDDTATLYRIEMVLRSPVPGVAPVVGTCGDDIFTAAVAVENNYRPSVGYPTITLTPEADISAVLMAGGIASNWNVPNDSDWVSDDTIYTDEVYGDYHPLYAVMARNETDTTGSYTIDATYTPGYEGGPSNGSYWAMLGFTFESEDTAPVQAAYLTNGEATATVTATLASAPTAGNAIVMYGFIRDQATKLDPTPYPDDGKWTFVGKADAGIPTKYDRVVCWRRCVDEGDTATYGMGAYNSRKAVHVSEWTSTTTTTDETAYLGGTPGSVVISTSVTPPTDGVTTTFYTASGYRPGSLLVYVDGVAIPAAAVTETDPQAGEFTLAWAPDADETITVTYMVG